MGWWAARGRLSSNCRLTKLDILHLVYYVFAVIKTWKNSTSRKFWEDQLSHSFRGLDRDCAIELLAALNVAKSLNDLSPLKSVGLHKLKGDRRKQWPMTINGRWRVCFVFKDGDAYDVEIVDYHKG
jgi:toxin HigB-1